jgi:poly-gamma-glutamate synthesis protein (capsule biosynthesis protein)
MKKLVVVVIVVGAIAVLALRTDAPTQILPPKKSEPVTITFVGDIMMDRGVRRSIENNFGGEYGALFANTSYLAQSDITFGNLEGSVAYGGTNVGSRFSFRMDPISLVALREAGFDIVSFANNHVGDYAVSGFLESLAQLTTNDILYTGAGEHYSDVGTPTVIDVRGTTIGFLASTDVGPNWLAATETKPGILLASDPDMATIVARAQEHVDILAMSVHWGNEYSPASTRQQKMARALVDAGVDIVVGHHPHVMQAVEEYNGKLIYYSLGNFIFDQYFSPHTMRGMVATVSIDPETKALTHTQQVSTLSRQFIPQPLIPFDESMLVTKTFTP